MIAKTERFEMRLEQQTIERLDRWRREQNDIPSRSEAVRRLVDAGLRISDSQNINLSAGEKLIAMMLRDLYKYHEVSGEIDPDFVSSVICGGHSWGLDWEYPGLFHDHEDRDTVVSEVMSMLNMWWIMEIGYAKLSVKNKKLVASSVKPFEENVIFRGFDGNNESEHFGVALFLINDLNRFGSFKGRELNSHSPTLDGYRRMLTVFEPMWQNLMGADLNAAQLIELLKAKIHPEYWKA